MKQESAYKNYLYIINIGSPWLIAATIVVFSEFLARRALLDSVLLVYNSPLSFLVITVFIGFTINMINGINNRPIISIISVSIPAFSLAYASGEKFRFLSAPLYPWDLMSARQIIDLIPKLAQDSIVSAFYATGFLALLLGVIVYFRRIIVLKVHQNKALRAVNVTVSAITVFIFVSAILKSETHSPFRFVGVENYLWDQSENYKINGFLLSFLMNVKSALVEAPPKYGKEAPERISSLAAYDVNRKMTGSRQRPNIIMIMNEAFWDPTRLPGVQFSKDPIPFFRALHARQESNFIVSPVWGGGTANAEFEALTGFSNAFLPEGSIPYQQYVSKKFPSLAEFFQRNGYTSIALHPFMRKFWERDVVYKNFGFDKYTDIDGFKGMEVSGGFISDGALADKILEEVEMSKRPVFLFAVSMQNHGPYLPNRYQDNDFKVIDGHMNETKRGTLESYAKGLSDADKSLQKIVDNVTFSGKPTIIIFFGDHLPYLGKDFSIYKDYGLLSSDVAPLSHIDLYKTPFVVWSNVSQEKEFGAISPNYLPAALMRTIGYEHPFYNEFLSQAMTDVPVLHRKLTYRYEGNGNVVRDQAHKKTVDDYKWIQYDIMFGEQYVADQIFWDSSADTGRR